MRNKTLNHPRNRLLPILAGFGLALVIAGCSDSGPAEEAGESIDDAMERAGENIEDAAREVEDTIDPPGPGERAGRAIDDAVDDVRD